MPLWQGQEQGGKYTATHETCGTAKTGIAIMKADTDQSKTPEANDDLKSLPLPELEKKPESSPDGLSQTEAQKRRTRYGPNELEEKKINPFLKFLSYFWGPIPWMIEAAVILTPQIVKRAYELYEQKGRQDGRADQDWAKAEREIRKDGPRK
jgi:magnesium-transporting ATPase (P-type)